MAEVVSSASARFARLCFDRAAGESNGDPIPRCLALDIDLRQVPLDGLALDALLRESEMLGSRFDRDREVCQVCCRLSGGAREADLLEDLVASLARRFPLRHLAGRPWTLRLGEPVAEDRLTRLIALGFVVSDRVAGAFTASTDPFHGSASDVLPLGPGARSRVGEWRFASLSSWARYRGALDAGLLPLAEVLERPCPVEPVPDRQAIVLRARRS